MAESSVPGAVPQTEAGKRALYGITEHTPVSVIAEMIEAIEQQASGGAVGEREGLNVERLAEAGANVLDGRRIGSVRLYRNTITPDDWQAIAAEYARLSVNEGESGVGEREEPLEQARDALLSVLTVCGLEGQDPSNTALAFQMIRDFARPAYDALVEAEKADD